MNKIDLEKLPFEYHLLRLLMATGKTVMGRVEDNLQAVDLSGPKMWALSQLAEAEEPMSISQLAKCMHVGRSNITQLVDRLEAEDLVRRIPNPEDRRGVLVELTAHGQERYTEGQEIHKRVTSELVLGLPDDLREGLEQHLELFLEHIRSLPQENTVQKF